MKEKKHKRSKKSYKTKDSNVTKKKSRRRSPSSSESSNSEEWVEKEIVEKPQARRDDWMAMTGMLKTFTKNDIRSKDEEKDKKHIDSYNPAMSSRELNPYWKHGGSGLPQTLESFRKSKPFMKPEENDNYYSKSTTKSNKSEDTAHNRSHYSDKEHLYNKKTSNWKYSEKVADKSKDRYIEKTLEKFEPKSNTKELDNENQISGKYLSDDKMNKLAAKIVKAEIIGNLTLAAELKDKLEAARQFRNQNPGVGKEEDEGVMLISENSMGNSRPLIKNNQGCSSSKGSKRKAETYASGERTKYFGDDDKYDLAQMFQEEKYGNNYNDEAELAKIASKHKNPNDDLEDIFTDEISKNRNTGKDSEMERSRAINEHLKIERSLEGCEYCIDSKNMLKHLIISCSNKTYLAVPAKKSLVKNHCIITTIQHSKCVTALDEDIWEEIMTYRKALTQFFGSQNQDVLFYETATKLYRYPHMTIHCIPLPRDVGDSAAIYFKKALLECEAEWSMNKKVIELKGKNIRKGVPKGLPYFWIDFGMDPGFAHVIEDQDLFPKTFAEEIVAGILDLDHGWRNPKKDCRDFQRKKVLDFINQWKSFDPVKKKDL